MNLEVFLSGKIRKLCGRGDILYKLTTLQHTVSIVYKLQIYLILPEIIANFRVQNADNTVRKVYGQHSVKFTQKLTHFTSTHCFQNVLLKL